MENSTICEKFLLSSLKAIEVLAAGCKPNRAKLGRSGSCNYVVLLLNKHGEKGREVELVETAFNVIWQLSFGNSYNRSLLRISGAENELHAIIHSSVASQTTRSRAATVLGWLKSQVGYFRIF